MNSVLSVKTEEKTAQNTNKIFIRDSSMSITLRFHGNSVNSDRNHIEEGPHDPTS